MIGADKQTERNGTGDDGRELRTFDKTLSPSRRTSDNSPFFLSSLISQPNVCTLQGDMSRHRLMHR